MAPRTILHVDMDSFFVSIERILDPSLIGKPVIVGGPPNSRGVVSSASYEARAFGVRSAMSSAAAARLCPQAVFVGGSMGRYAEFTRRIHESLLTMTPMVQMASQDEAYLDMSGTERLWGAPLEMAARACDVIRDATGLPCSVGISTCRMVSKIASGLCKPRGILWVPATSEADFMRPLEIGAIPGIGPKTQERLRVLGIRRVGDVQFLGRDECARLLGPGGTDLFDRAMGIDDAPVETGGDAKSVSNETTFDHDIVDREVLDGVLAMLSEKVAARLRDDGLSARTVGIKFRYAGFETHTAARTLSAATNDDLAIRRIAVELLDEKRDAGRPIRLLGVACSQFETGGGQLDLLEDEGDGAKRRRLLTAMDAVRARHGGEILRRGSTRRDPDRD